MVKALNALMVKVSFASNREFK